MQTSPTRRTPPFLALGCAFLPIGVATHQPTFLILGLVFLAMAATSARRPKP